MTQRTRTRKLCYDYFLPLPYIVNEHPLLPMQAQQYPVEPLELLGIHCSVHDAF